MALKDNLNDDSNVAISRRNFFKIFSGAFTGLVLITLGIPLVESVVGFVSRKKSKKYSKLTSINSITEGKPADLPLMTIQEDAFIKKSQPENVWAVKNDGTGVTVFSPICPHLGCRYQWHPERKLFICPCHHSMFNIEGKVVSGPAPRPLDTLPTEVKNNYLYVLWERFKPGIPTKEII